MKFGFIICLITFALTAKSQSTIYALTNDGSPVQLVTVDPATGTISPIGEIAGATDFGMAYSTFDTGRDHFIFIGKNSDLDNTLYSVWAENAFVMYAPYLSDTITDLQYNCNDGKVYAVRQTHGNYQIVTMNMITADATLVSELPGKMAVENHATALDEFENSFVAFCTDTSGEHLLIYVDLGTGVIDTLTSIVAVNDLQYRCADGLFYGLKLGFDDAAFISLDDVTGDTVMINSFSNIGGYYENKSVLLEPEMQYVEEVSDWVDGGWKNFLVSINLTTGTEDSYIEFDPAVTAFETAYSCFDAPLANSIHDVHVIQLFPNPATDQLRIALQLQATDPLKIIITDETGRQMHVRADRYTNSIIVNTSELTPGIYTIRLMGDDLMWNDRFEKF